MESRKRNVQIIVRVTEEERVLIEKEMKQIPGGQMNGFPSDIPILTYG